MKKTLVGAAVCAVLILGSGGAAFAGERKAAKRRRDCGSASVDAAGCLTAGRGRAGCIAARRATVGV